MAKKITYRIRNWKNYNRSLINRGNLTLWFSENAIKSWYQKPKHSNKRGRPRTYSNSYIELALTLRTLFHFPLRTSDLNIQITSLKKKGKALTDLVIDSTGLKIFGEGEWKMRTHGKQKRRTWRKYHVSVDPDSHEVTAVELTEANVHDCTMLSTLLSAQKNIGNIYADGAYSFKQNFDAIADKGGKPFIPIRSGTYIVKEAPSKGEIARNQLLKAIWKTGGRSTWKKTSGYHRRSLVETHMFRLKTILGGILKGRKLETQTVEAKIMAKILNKMTSLGMPKSVKAF